jgi:hypothetical protein
LGKYPLRAPLALDYQARFQQAETKGDALQTGQPMSRDTKPYNSKATVRDSPSSQRRKEEIPANTSSTKSKLQSLTNLPGNSALWRAR